MQNVKFKIKKKNILGKTLLYIGGKETGIYKGETLSCILGARRWV
jgi:hypothetical protein